MTDKELKHLSRSELLEMFIAQREENEKLKENLEEAQKALSDRRITIRQTDPMADTAMQFAVAQNAAEQNLENTQSLNREHKRRCRSVLRSALCTLITVAAIAILVATLWLPMLRIYGQSMAPTLQSGEILLSVKTSDFERGEIVAFYYNNKILVKRVICGPGDWINIDSDGAVYVNDVRLEEPYLTETALGDCNIELPYQVPDGRFFVMGDHRSTSVDSRNTAVGCVSQEQIVGKIIFRIWPFGRMGIVN